jgi:RNA polymerase sigma-70 factor (ECF subfamily)
VDAVAAKSVLVINATNEERFATLYDAHYDEIHAFCARRVETSSAQDATSEVFAVVWRRLDDVPADAARAWIFGVARGVIRNHWRTSGRRGRLIGRVRNERSATAVDPEANAVRSADAERVRAALATLRRGDQEILRLAAWEELTGEEIAFVLGISLAAAQQRTSRARQRLSRSLARQGHAWLDEEVAR